MATRRARVHYWKTLVRAVARGRGPFPGGVRQCSGKRYEGSIRPYRSTSKDEPSRCGCQCAGSCGGRNAFSKKLENHAAAVALYFMWYNFGRVHQTLGVTPTMEAGVSDHVWSIEEIVGLLA